MHRSRLSVLAIFAAVAACSTRDDSEVAEPLSQDLALVARLAMDLATRQLPLPDACGAMTVAAQPAVANKTAAEQLTRLAYEAEMLGDIEEARSLLRRASELDATNESTAYHLGRASEALGDRASALTAYCRFLALTPTTAEAVEARQRVATLSPSVPRVTAGSVSERAPTRRRAPAATTRHVARRRRTVGPRLVASATVEQSVSSTSSAYDTRAASAAASGADDPPSPSEPATDSADVAATADSTAARSDVVAPTRRVPPVDQPSTPSRPERRGPSRAQGASIGAVTGAIIGAATARSVKGAVIGAAAGGLLGTVVGGGLRPVGSGIQP